MMSFWLEFGRVETACLSLPVRREALPSHQSSEGDNSFPNKLTYGILSRDVGAVRRGEPF